MSGRLVLCWTVYGAWMGFCLGNLFQIWVRT